ncbi:GD10657 [Drosophila simulans]|uniref:GD10657 n=1 Tax=Drosophila simulans TaxID=7240 RepID=B4QH96_DROSI|nr:GD10657 [Drosophila simulans]
MAGYRSLPLAPVAATAAVQPTMGGVPPTMAAYAHHQSMTAMSNNGIIYQSAVHARELQGWHFFTTRLTPYNFVCGCYPPRTSRVLTNTQYKSEHVDKTPRCARTRINTVLRVAGADHTLPKKG